MLGVEGRGTREREEKEIEGKHLYTLNREAYIEDEQREEGDANTEQGLEF